jgi:hypothetical protein
MVGRMRESRHVILVRYLSSKMGDVGRDRSAGIATRYMLYVSGTEIGSGRDLLRPLARP